MNLHRHTHFSVLDAATRIDELIAKVQERGENAVCITDHGSLGGCYKLWKAARKAEIKPVLGCECYCVFRYGTKSAKIPYNYAHIVLLALNQQGWNNIKKLQEIAWEQGFNSKPCIQLVNLVKYNEGIAITTACIGGIVGNYYLGLDKAYADKSLKKRKAKVVKVLKYLWKTFEGRMFLELQLHDDKKQIKLNKYLLKLHKSLGIPYVIAYDEHYLQEDGVDIQDVLICKKWHDLLSDPENHTYGTTELWYKGFKELNNARKKWHSYLSVKQLKRGLKNAKDLVDGVEEYNILPEGSALPVISDDPDRDLKSVCKQHKRYKRLMRRSEYKKRFEQEYAVISGLGFSNYFLVVHDMLEFCKRAKIPYNGRGSVNGSLIAYFMTITFIDPILFDCPFERFLTEDRLSLPDIDMDVGKIGRQRVVEYLGEKYGEDAVAHICSYAKWKPKGAIKDVGKVLGYNYQQLNGMTRKVKDHDIDIVPNAPIEDYRKAFAGLEKYSELWNFLQQNEDLMDLSEKVLGTINQVGIHASGIVVTPTTLTDWCPVAYTVSKGKNKSLQERITEWDMYDLEDAEILKVDVLGQNTLDIMNYAIKLINKRHAVEYNDVQELCLFGLDHLEDEATFEQIQKANVKGIFQIGGSDGMAKLAKDIKPESIEEVIALITLFRPAVLDVGMHDEYVRRKFGKSYELPHEEIEEILSNSRGILLYQEQCGQLAMRLAGFTASEADHFRKGIKLKDKSKIAPWKKKFMKGCKKLDKVDEEDAKSIWKLIETFGGYGFNRAHAASYALIAYLSAYLKTHYPKEYMTSLLSHKVDDSDELAVYLAECKRLGIKLLLPKINLSTDNFKLLKRGVLYPLVAIKQVGNAAYKAIIQERKSGKFESLVDFIDRTDGRVVKVNIITNLILAGAFREFGNKRKLYDQLIDLRGEEKTCRQFYCYDCRKRYITAKSFAHIENVGIACPVCGSISISTDYSVCRGKKFDKNFIQDRVYGFIAKASKLKRFAAELAHCGAEPISVIEELNEGDKVTVGFEVINVKKHVDKNANTMAFVDIADTSGESSLTIFASDWKKLEREINKGACYVGTFIKNRGSLLFNSRTCQIQQLIIKS